MVVVVQAVRVHEVRAVHAEVVRGLVHQRDERTFIPGDGLRNRHGAVVA